MRWPLLFAIFYFFVDAASGQEQRGFAVPANWHFIDLGDQCTWKQEPLDPNEAAAFEARKALGTPIANDCEGWLSATVVGGSDFSVCIWREQEPLDPNAASDFRQRFKNRAPIDSDCRSAFGIVPVNGLLQQIASHTTEPTKGRAWSTLGPSGHKGIEKWESIGDGSKYLQEFVQDQAVLSHIGGAINALLPQIDLELKTTGDSHAVVELTISNAGDTRSIVHKEVVSEGRTAVEALRFAVGAPRDKLSKPETSFYYVSVTRHADGTKGWAIETFSTEFVEGAKANYHDEILNYRRSKGPMGPGIIYLPGMAPKDKPGSSAASGPANPFRIPNYNDPADVGAGTAAAPAHVEILGSGADRSQPHEGDGRNNVLLESHTYELSPDAPPVIANPEFGERGQAPDGGNGGDKTLDFDDFGD